MEWNDAVRLGDTPPEGEDDAPGTTVDDDVDDPWTFTGDDEPGECRMEDGGKSPSRPAHLSYSARACVCNNAHAALYWLEDCPITCAPRMKQDIS